MPVINSAGVTSKPGLRAELEGLATRTYWRRPATFEYPRRRGLRFIAFFDGDVETGFEIPIDGGKRDGDVEGDVVACGEDGFGVGADFVGDFAGAAEGAVAADDDEIDFAALHEMAGGVVGDDLVRNFLLREFPGGESGALGTGPGFIAEDVEFFALGLGGIHRGGGAADVDKRQPAGVAMGEDAHAVAD